MQVQALGPNKKGMPRHHKSFPLTKTGRWSSKMILDLTPTVINMRNATEWNVEFMTRPSGEGLTDKNAADHRRWTTPAKLTTERKQGLHSRSKARLTKLVTWSKMMSIRGSLGLSYCSVILAPIVGYYVIKPVRLGIDITVRIFNTRVIREK